MISKPEQVLEFIHVFLSESTVVREDIVEGGMA
jgi:hypothetical protein